MLSDREWRSLRQIELALRKQDDRAAGVFERLRLDLSLAFAEDPDPPKPAARVRIVRWVLALSVFALIPVVWAFVLLGEGDLAEVADVLVLPTTALLAVLSLTLHPDRHRLTTIRPRDRR